MENEPIPLLYRKDGKQPGGSRWGVYATVLGSIGTVSAIAFFALQLRPRIPLEDVLFMTTVISALTGLTAGGVGMVSGSERRRLPALGVALSGCGIILLCFSPYRGKPFVPKTLPTSRPPTSAPATTTGAAPSLSSLSPALTIAPVP